MRMFSVTPYIPLFIPSVNNYLLSSFDVLHRATCLYNTILAVSKGGVPGLAGGRMTKVSEERLLSTPA